MSQKKTSGKSAKSGKGKTARAEALNLQVQQEEAVKNATEPVVRANDIKIGEVTGAEFEERRQEDITKRIRCSNAEMLEVFRNKGVDAQRNRIFTEAAWAKYTGPSRGRDAFIHWFRLDDAIVLAREVYGVITEEILDMYVHEVGKPCSKICFPTAAEIKLGIQREMKRQKPNEEPPTLKEIRIPPELHSRVLFTGVEVVVPPVGTQKRLEFLEYAAAAYRNEPEQLLAGLYRSPWYLVTSVFSRPPNGEPFTVKGAPWLFDFSTGSYIPRDQARVKDSPFAERAARMKEQGIHFDWNRQIRYELLRPYHEMVQKQNSQDRRREQREVHSLAKQVAWKASVDELGLAEDFDISEYAAVDAAAKAG